MRVRPSDYPPPFDAGRFVVEPTDSSECIEVGVLVVGAGPAGLACAIRLGQLLEEHPEVAERLGDVPIAVLEKGKHPGSHLLSGAIVDRRGLQQLLGARYSLADVPSFGEIERESVYVLTEGSALPIPVPPPMRNRGNVIISVSAFGRWLAERAEEAGASVLPGTVGRSLLTSDGRVVGVRTADKGRAADGSVLPGFEPGVDIVAKVTVLAEGTQGHLTGLALDHFNLRPSRPQVWELAVKEVWRTAKPLDRVIHTMGWPLRMGRKYREFGGSFVYPMGEDMLTVGMVVGLDYRDAELSVHDLLQELKLHPKLRSHFEGGERLEWGAKTIPSGGFDSLPRKLHAPGVLVCGDGAGMVNVPALKGIHYALESGRLAAEAAFSSWDQDGNLGSYDAAVRSSFIWSDLHSVRNMRQVFARGFFVGGALASGYMVSKGRLTLGAVPTESDSTQPLLYSNRADSYPAPDGKITFDKLSSVFAAGNQTRDDQPNHIQIEQKVPREIADLWVHLCPAQVYEVGEEDGAGLVSVSLSPSNCVQCGAISAKGGRLTPPEGGSGPEYSLT